MLPIKYKVKKSSTTYKSRDEKKIEMMNEEVGNALGNLFFLVFFNVNRHGTPCYKSQFIFW